jgi:Skp family chaperone for outer membrane proteins
MKKLLVAAFLLAVNIPVSFANTQNYGIAVVDIQQIVQDSLAAKDIRAQIEKKRVEYQAEIDKKEEGLNKTSQELNKQYSEFQAQSDKKSGSTSNKSTISKDALEQKMRDLNEKALEVQKEVQMKKNSLDQASIDALGEIQQAVEGIIAKLAEEKGFVIAVPTSQILFSKPQLDISAEVLKRLNEKLKRVEVKIAQPSKLKENK